MKKIPSGWFRTFWESLCRSRENNFGCKVEGNDAVQAGSYLLKVRQFQHKGHEQHLPPILSCTFSCSCTWPKGLPLNLTFQLIWYLSHASSKVTVILPAVHFGWNAEFLCLLEQIHNLVDSSRLAGGLEICLSQERKVVVYEREQIWHKQVPRACKASVPAEAGLDVLPGLECYPLLFVLALLLPQIS